MSYILDALQKSADEAKPVTRADKFPGAVGNVANAKDGLSLPWKLAIGAVLLANVVLVYLWRTDRTSEPAIAQTSAGTSLGQSSQPPSSLGNPSGSARKIPLPGIVSPRDLPLPRKAGTNRADAGNNTAAPGTLASGTASAGTARTFKPTGRPITIAGEPELETNGSSSAGTKTPRPTTARGAAGTRVIPQPAAALPPSARARSASALSSLSESAREALQVLSFSFHIYGDESDLRSVGVNGQRITEGKSVATDDGKTFTVREITDSGAIIEFEHDGEPVSVAIPVMEDWKDS